MAAALACNVNASLVLAKPSYVSNRQSWRPLSAGLAARPRGRALIKCAQEPPAATPSGGGVGIWLGRVAMLGFAGTIAVEVSTGKGLLENVGLATPAPVPALAVAAALGLIAALAIFSSAPKE